MPARQPRKNHKASASRFYGVQQPAPPKANFSFHFLQSQLFQDDDDCSFWPSDSLMASVVQAFNQEEEEEDLLRQMTSLSLVMALGNCSRTSNAITLDSQQKANRDQTKKKERERPYTSFRNTSHCRHNRKTHKFARTFRDLNIPFSFSERRLREIQNFTRYATKIAERNRQKRSNNDLVVSSSPLARAAREEKENQEETESSMEVLDGEGGKVKLRRCLSVPQLDHLASISFENLFGCSTQEIDMLPEIEEAN